MILKGILLALWLVGFGTFARLYFEIRRINPQRKQFAVSASWLASHTIRSTVWWIATIICVAASFALTRAWDGPLTLWIAVAATDLFPIAVLALYMTLYVKAHNAART